MSEGARQPAVRRMKTYTAESGYVYQYYFVGQRPALAGAPENPATEFIFDVSADRKTTYAVSVLLRAEAAAQWAGRHGRPLSEAEQYAAAKMRLLRGFDEIEDLAAADRRWAVGAELLEELLGRLGLE